MGIRFPKPVVKQCCHLNPIPYRCVDGAGMPCWEALEALLQVMQNPQPTLLASTGHRMAFRNLQKRLESNRLLQSNLRPTEANKVGCKPGETQKRLLGP